MNKRPTHWNFYNLSVRNYPSLAAAKRDLKTFVRRARRDTKRLAAGACKRHGARVEETDLFYVSTVDCRDGKPLNVSGSNHVQNLAHFHVLLVPRK